MMLRFLLAVVVLAAPLLAADYDLLFRDARVVDGSGNPWFRADVAVQGGRIAAIGRLEPSRAARVVDARGRVLAPGFIDVHTHIENSVRENPTAESFLRDGVTTLITGNCGGSEEDLAAFFGDLDQRGLGANVASLIGHNTVRRAVLGEASRAPTPEELARMATLVEKGMRDGAVGFATGLIYVPGTYAQTDEIVALARVAARHGGVYATHMRNENDRILEALDEAARIAREADIRVQVSHLKVADYLAGMDEKVIAALERYRREGLEMVADQYPYAASSTSLQTLLPSWAQADGFAAMRERLESPETRQRIITEMRTAATRRNRADYGYVAVASHQPEPALNGKRIPEITSLQGRTAGLDGDIETVLELLARPGRTSVVYFSWSEPGVDRILRHPLVGVASDGGIQSLGPTVPHPRSYGTNARVLGHFVRERKVVSLEDAVRKMTSLPAQTFGFRDRGLVREGYAADLVLLDAAKVADKATFALPHQFSAGFDWVLVNGVATVEEGVLTTGRGGKVLRR